MRKAMIRWAGVTFMAIALSSCGGSDSVDVAPAAQPVPPAPPAPSPSTPGPFTISGAVLSLTGAGLVLQNNGSDSLAVAALAGSFAFPGTIANGTPYNVTVLSQPTGQTCAVQNGSGTANANVTNVAALALALIVWAFAGFAWSVPLWLIAIFVIQFFRDPPRTVPSQGNAVLSPADGRIVKVEKVRDPMTERDALLISVFMNVFNVHSNRAPVDGTVERIQYNPGKFVNADLDKASTENERNAMVVRLTGGERISVVQVAGLIARRILCYAKEGQRLTRGERYGFIRFGSRVDVYLPLTARPKVAVGDVVHATTTILAELG